MSLKQPTPNQNDTFDVNLLKSFDICTNNVGGVWGAVLVHFLVRKLSTIITEHALLERERGKRKQQDGHTGHRAAKLSTTRGGSTITTIERTNPKSASKRVKSNMHLSCSFDGNMIIEIQQILK